MPGWLEKLVDVIPTRLQILSLFSFAAGIVLFFVTENGLREYRKMQVSGILAEAVITSATASKDKDGEVRHSVSLSWLDDQRHRRASRPQHVSETFWRSIAPAGELPPGRTTRIVYLADEPGAFPLILADHDEHVYDLNGSRFASLFFVLLGIGLGWFVWRRSVYRLVGRFLRAGA